MVPPLATVASCATFSTSICGTAQGTRSVSVTSGDVPHELIATARTVNEALPSVQAGITTSSKQYSRDCPAGTSSKKISSSPRRTSRRAARSPQLVTVPHRSNSAPTQTGPWSSTVTCAQGGESGLIVTEHSLLLTQPVSRLVRISVYVPWPTWMQRVVWASGTPLRLQAYEKLPSGPQI